MSSLTIPARVRALPLVGAISVGLLAACAGDPPSAPGGPGDGLVRFVVTNDLQAPVTVAIDDTVSLILSAGESAGLAVAPSKQWLTWTSAKAADSAGTLIPDDIGRVQVRITGIRDALDITNIIDDTTYVTASFFNQTSAQVVIGVFEGAAVQCASVLPPLDGGAPGFTRIGYYRLLPTTEIRAYRAGSGCTGPYVAWPRAQIAAYAPRSGQVNLVLTTAP